MMTNLQSSAFVAKTTQLLSSVARLRLLLVMFLTLTVSANVWGAEVTFNISDYASANNWTNGTAYSSANINTHLTATKGGTGDNGKYYTSNSSWRFYEANDGSITISTNSGTLQSITFTYSKGNDGVLKYNNNGISSGTACSVSGTSATFTVSHNSGTKNGNVQITSITITYTPAASCDKKVSLTKGDETNGTFTLDKANGTYETCDAQLVITLSNITPSAGYQFSEITQSGINSGVTIDQANKTVTYAKNTSGESTINVTFEQKQSATITLSEAGVETGVTGKYVGDTYELPSTTSQSCGDLEFVGWSTVEINNSASKPASNYYAKGASVTLAANQTFYAVFATESETTSGTTTTPTTASLSFASTAQRTTLTTSQQVWTQNGITLTNDKGSSTSNVADYYNPARFYKSSKITVSFTSEMTQIVFVCSSSDYATELKNSIESGATVTTSGNTVTAELTEPATSFVISSLSGQVRMNSVEVTYNKTTTGGTTITYSDYTTQCSTETLVSVLPKIVNFWQSIFGVSLGYLRDKTGYRHVLGGIVVVSLHHRCTKNRFSSYQYVKDRFRRIVPFRVANNRAFFFVSRGQINDQCPRVRQHSRND